VTGDPPSRGFGVAGEPEELSTKGEAVLSTTNFLRVCKISQSATAPEKMRMKVKLAASIAVSLRAARHRSELLANAIIASSVRMKIRGFRRRKSNEGRSTSNPETELVPG
jgi:hypothetical protein